MMMHRLFFFTSPCKGEVGRAAAGWGSIVISDRMNPSRTLPLSGEGKSKREARP
jgi:hypothetical protein